MFVEQKSQSAQIVAPPFNSAVTKTDLIRKVRTLLIQLRARGTVTLAGGPATAILNRGSLLAAFDRFGTDENGFQPITADPMLLQIMAQMMAPRDFDKGRVRLTNPANGAYDLEESVFLPFGSILAAVPTETCYMERNPQQQFSAFVQLGPASVVGRLVQTPGTALLSNVTVDVVQRYDLQRERKAIFLPQIRHLAEVQVNGASPNFVVKLESVNYLQGLVIQQTTTGAGEVDDIITSLALRADGRDFIGPQQIAYEELQAEAQMEFSGDCVPAGYLPIWFRSSGRLSNIVNANSLANFRVEANVAPSAAVGAGTSIIRVLALELVSVPGLTNPPPFPV